MSDDKMKLEIDLDVQVNGISQSQALREEFRQMQEEIRQFGREMKLAANPMSSLGRARSMLSANAARAGNAALDLEKQSFAELKRKLAFDRKMRAQQSKEESAAAKKLREEQAETKRSLADQLNFNMRMLRQRERAEAEAERSTRREIEQTAKARSKANAAAIREARDLQRAQGKAAERAGRGAGQIKSGIGRVAGTAAATGVAGGYALERAVSKGISARADIDDVETQLRIFNDVEDEKSPGQRRKMTAEDITKLRRGPEGLDQLAISTGNTVADTLRAYNESSKAGLIDPMGQTRNILKAGSALELDPMKTTKLAGTLARNLGSAATPDRMYKVLNAIGVGAREDPTQAGEIVEGMNRAQGLLSMSKGFTPEDLVAMVSGGQSVGIDPGKAGTAVTALGTALLRGGGKFTDPMDRRKNNWAAKKLGFGSGKDLANKFAGENGKAVYYQVLQGLKGMAPQLRQQVASALSGNQWGDEDLQIVNGLDGQLKTDKEIHDPQNANFINEASAEKMKSWRMLWAQSQTIFSLFWESFGKGFDEILREINSFFLDLNGKFRYDDVTGAVKQALDGFKSGLGFNSWSDALKAMFPSSIGDFGKQLGQFAKGFGTALREIGGAVSTVARVFTGSNASAEGIGRLTAQFLSLGAAAVALAPVVGVIGGVSSIILGIVGVARAAAGVLGMGAGAAAGGLGGGAVAGALAGVARLLSGGFALGLAAEIGNLRGEISTLILDAVRPLVSAIWSGLKQAFTWQGLKAGGSALLDELIPSPLKRWMDGGSPDQSKGAADPKADGSHWIDPPSRDAEPTRKLTEAVKENTTALQGKARLAAGATVQTAAQQSGDGTITYDEWQAQFVGLKGAALGRALEAQKDRSGGPIWGSSASERVNQGLRGHIGRLRGGAGGGSGAGTPEGDPVQGALNPRLAGSRKALMDELDRDPALRRDVLKTASMENRGSPFKMQTVLESMTNRAKMNGYTSLRQAIHSGFYGPVNRGGLRGALSEKDRADGEKALAQVKAGSNAIGYRTDQGMLTDPGARRYMQEADHSGHRVIGGENFFLMGQKGRAWAKQQEALDARSGSGDAAQQLAADAKRMQDLGAGLGKPKLGDLDLTRQAGPGAGASLGQNTPLRQAPVGPGGGGQGGGNQVHAPITINGAGSNPEELASRVQRHLQDSMNRRTHDYDGFA